MVKKIMPLFSHHLNKFKYHEDEEKKNRLKYYTRSPAANYIKGKNKTNILFHTEKTLKIMNKSLGMKPTRHQSCAHADVQTSLVRLHNNLYTYISRDIVKDRHRVSFQKAHLE